MTCPALLPVRTRGFQAKSDAAEELKKRKRKLNRDVTSGSKASPSAPFNIAAESKFVSLPSINFKAPLRICPERGSPRWKRKNISLEIREDSVGMSHRGRREGTMFLQRQLRLYSNITRIRWNTKRSVVSQYRKGNKFPGVCTLLSERAVVSSKGSNPNVGWLVNA